MDQLHFRRVRVAGSGGMLGAAVAGELAMAGHELLHATAPVDGIVHCPAPVPPGRLTHRRLAAHRRAEAERAQALAGDALATDARLVHVGSAFAWGDHGSSWIDEGTPQRPAPLGAGDADVARRLLALRDERGLDVVLVALGLVYGPGRWAWPPRGSASRWPARSRHPSACATPARRPSWAGRHASRPSARVSGPRARADRSSPLNGVPR